MEETTEGTVEKALSMDDSTAYLVRRMTEWETSGQDVINGKRIMVELDQRRQKCREALRQLRMQTKGATNKKSKNWMCLGSTTFIEVPAEQAIQMIEEDMVVIDETIENAREELKKRVNKLKKLENVKDLEQLGFTLQPIA